jgi:cytochrome c-type protein NapC
MASKKIRVFRFLFVLGLGMVLAGLFNVGLDYTNTTEFCTSCHSMKVNLEELKERKHWMSRSGVHAGCADCHVPKQFLPKMKAKIMAAKDVWHEILGTIDTPEKYEQHRWRMANQVWDKMRASNSRECRSCHSFEHMDLSLQDRSARKRHGNAEDEGKSCIDCHQGIAHEEPDEPEDSEEADDEDA